MTSMFRSTAISVAVQLLVCTRALSQQSTAPGDLLPRVEVSSEAQQRDAASVSIRTTITRAEIERFGDSSIADILRRIPGVTVQSVAGSGSEVRMRGMASSYARLLINGEPVPARFSIDSLAPVVIDRIEVIRSAGADGSSQSVAGTINIVTRAASATGGSLLVTPSFQRGVPSVTASVAQGWKSGKFAFDSSLALARDLGRTTTTGAEVMQRASGLEESRWSQESALRSTTANINQSLRYTSDGLSIRLQGLVRHRTIDGDAIENREALGFVNGRIDRMTTRVETTQAQIKGSLDYRVTERSKLEGSATISGHYRKADATLQVTDSTGPMFARDTSSAVRTAGNSASARYSTRFDDAHLASVGAEVETTSRRDETHVSQSGSLVAGSLPTFDRYLAEVRKSGLYAQNEWSPIPSLQVQAGVRREEVRTSTEGMNAEWHIAQTFRFVSPVTQVVWRMGPGARNSLRVSFNRSYRSVDPRDLIPVRTLSSNNSAVDPDLSGNPALRPEKIRGVEAAYEHRVAGHSQLIARVFTRSISNAIARDLELLGGRWVERRINVGTAHVRGLELEGKIDVSKLYAGSPRISVSPSLGVTHSTVAAFGPRSSRLEQETPFTAAIALDHSLTGGGATAWGLNANYRRGSLAQVSRLVAVREADRTVVDVYAVFRVRPEATLRLAASVPVGASPTSARYFNDTVTNTSRYSSERLSPTVRATLRVSL